MSENERELKEALLAIREKDWEIPSKIDRYEFAKEMFAYIGSIDPVLRDELILELLLKMIENHQLSNEQMKEMLLDALSEQHLFYGLGTEKTDSVFNRTFTLLIIEGIMEANNEAIHPFLDSKEVMHVHNKVIEYSRKERDLRGYVEGKGWAHSSAHTADALNSIVHAKVIGQQELLEIMDLIREKICVDTYTYINNEEERLITTFFNIYDRGIISVNEITRWFESFLEVECEEKLPNKEHLRENRKLFFRGLRYRANKLPIEKEITDALDQILESYECR